MFPDLAPSVRTTFRVAAGIVIASATGYATFLLLLVGAITFDGCFISCNDPNVVGGSLLLAAGALSAGVTVSAAAWGFIGWRKRTLIRITAVVCAVAGIMIAALMASWV